MEVLNKIERKGAIVGIIGMGYVGLPLAILCSDGGFQTIGFDIDEEKTKKLNDGISYIKHIKEEDIKKAKEKNFHATSDFKKLSKCDVIIICVPTPLTENLEPDMQYIENTGLEISKNLRKEQLIVLESTTYPGTTEEFLIPILEKSKLKAGDDFYVAFSPEREDPGNPNFHTRNIPKVVGGFDEKSLKVAVSFYEKIVEKVVPVSSLMVAESCKIVENMYRAVNIAMVNELKILFLKMGIDIWEVIKAASTKPFGFQPFYPGPGLGGHCIPIDPFYLSWKAKEYDLNLRFVELSGEVNISMPYFVIGRLIDALNERGKALKGCNVLLIGIAYKKNVDDLRESPALKIWDILLKKGAKVSYHDPFIPKVPKTRKYKFEAESKLLNKEILESFDAVIITTDHSSIDYELIKKFAKLIIDTRGVYQSGMNVFKA